MSILPPQAQGSTTSSSSSYLHSSQNPIPNHGNPNPNPPLLPLSPQSQRHIERLRISDHDSGLSNIGDEDIGGSSEPVTELGTPLGQRISSNQDAQMHSPSDSGCRGVKSADSKRKTSGGIVSPRGPSNGSTHPAGRRAQMTNGNHLLNFHYDPIARPQSRPRPTPPRRPQKLKPYNRDLFLQANYKFVMLDTGEYAPESMDPDKMLQWEDIICVRYSSPFPVQCPICLEYPLCPQITSCGHIFCFPCILQYLLMGKENHKVDCYRRCPLCFVMISPKDLYTISIENVKQYSIGDTIEFVLLTRQKDSFTSSCKSNQETNSLLCSNGPIYDPFSKSTFTSDVDLSVRQAISDLDSWLVRADSGLIDDLEKLPYVCAAMELLEERKTYWNEHRASDSNKSCGSTGHQRGSQRWPSSQNASSSDHYARDFEHGIPYPDVKDQNKSHKSDDGNVSDENVDVVASVDDRNITLSSSYDESKSLPRDSNESKNVKDKDSFNFYQAIDGQHIILHQLNMKCLLHHYGSYDKLPHRIRGKILQLDTVTQSEAMRRRYRYLSHFSLTTTYELCEVDLSETLPSDALFPFIDEIKKREKQRKQLAKKERKETLKAEAASSLLLKAEAASAISLPVCPSFGQSSHDVSPTFSLDDFEALGSSTVVSTSPPITGERKLFSHVTRLGFAAGCDSPALKSEEKGDPHNKEANDSSGATGSRNPGTTSFASITSRAKSVENLNAPKVNETGKKGKKPSRVLLSTAGGRRY